MEVRVHEYQCIKIAGKFYLRRLTVDNNLKATAGVASIGSLAITGIGNLLNKKIPHVVISPQDLLPLYQLHESCNEVAIDGHTYTEFEIEIEKSEAKIIPNTTAFAELCKRRWVSNLSTNKVAKIKPSIFVTEKMLLKKIAARFYQGGGTFDEVADEILSQYKITQK